MLVPAGIVRGSLYAGVFLLLAGFPLAVADGGRPPGVDGTPGGPVFLENRGQWPETVRFRVHGGLPGYVDDQGLWIWLEGSSGRERSHPPHSARGSWVRLVLEGSASVSPEGEGSTAAEYAVFRSRSPSLWGTVASYRSVLYRGVVDGIDLRVRPGGGQIEYDLLVAPSSDPSRMVVRCEGVECLRIEDDGTLVLETPAGELRQPPPRSWEVLPQGGTVEVRSRFRILGEDRYGFEVEGRDTSRPLVIDPVLQWGVLLGGSKSDDALCVCIDSAGGVIVAGRTLGEWPPESIGTPGFDTEAAGSYDVYVSRLDAATGQVLATTFLGGEMEDRPVDVAVDSTGNVSVVGWTLSPDFPIQGGVAYHASHDGFVASFTPNLDELRFSTTIGGSVEDVANAVSADSEGFVIVSGHTASSELVTTPGAFQPFYGGGPYDAFVLRFDPDPDLETFEEHLVYGSFLGGSGQESLPSPQDQDWFPDRTSIGDHAILSDDEPTVCLTGVTNSNDFPLTADAWKTTRNSNDAYITVLRLEEGAPAAEQLVYSTYIGGDGAWDSATAIAVDGGGGIWITGWTYSGNYPRTPGAVQQGLAGRDDIFLTRLLPSLPVEEQLYFSVLLGSENWEWGLDLAVDAENRAFVVGGGDPSTLTRLPGLTPPLSPSSSGSLFFAIDPGEGYDAPSSVLFSTGLGYAMEAAVATGPDGRVCAVTPGSAVPGMPEIRPHGGGDGLVLFLELQFPDVDLTAEILGDGLVRLDGSATRATGSRVLSSFFWDFGDGSEVRTTPASEDVVEHRYTEGGAYLARLTVANEADARGGASAPVLISCPRGATEPWIQGDIGSVLFPGTATRASEPKDDGGEEFSFCAGGNGVLALEDRLFFLHQRIEGYTRLTARVDQVTAEATYYRLGLMFRESQEPDAPAVAIVLRKPGSSGIEWRRRTDPGALIQRKALEALPSMPFWIRIERLGDRWFRGSYRAEGESEWTILYDEQEVILPPEAFVGFFAGEVERIPTPTAPSPYHALSGDITLWVETIDGVVFLRGDSNDSGLVDMSDAVYILNYLFLGGPAPGCLDAADADDSGVVELTDAVRILNHLFLGGDPPEPPYPDSGLDPTDDPLESCEAPGV